MRFLKQKISRALQKFKPNLEDFEIKTEASSQEGSNESLSDTETIIKKEEQVSVKIESMLKMEPNSNTESSSSPILNRSQKNTSSNKNIIKNYSRAIVNFILSRLALPYLSEIVRQEGIELEEFITFIEEQKNEITSIKNLREMLLVEDDDDAEIAALKAVFQKICEVFLKDFSVNWIFSSKITDKMTHIKYRFKILRRIRNPEHFTYLEDYKKSP